MAKTPCTNTPPTKIPGSSSDKQRQHSLNKENNPRTKTTIPETTTHNPGQHEPPQKHPQHHHHHQQQKVLDFFSYVSAGGLITALPAFSTNSFCQSEFFPALSASDRPANPSNNCLSSLEGSPSLAPKIALPTWIKQRRSCSDRSWSIVYFQHKTNTGRK